MEMDQKEIRDKLAGLRAHECVLVHLKRAPRTLVLLAKGTDGFMRLNDGTDEKSGRLIFTEAIRPEQISWIGGKLKLEDEDPIP